MVKIIDSLISKSDSWARLKCTWYQVTVLGYDDRENASYDDSTVVSSTFYAVEGENPDYNSDQKIKDWGDTQQEQKVMHPASIMSFNEFKSDGVRDRVTVEGYGTQQFEVWSVDNDRFWRQGSQTIFLRPL